MGGSLSKEDALKYVALTGGTFSEREVKHLHKEFTRYAAPADKVMGLREFNAYVHSMGVFTVDSPAHSFEQLFKGFDLNRDGRVDFGDFVRFHFAVSCNGDDLPQIIFQIIGWESPIDAAFVTYQQMSRAAKRSAAWVGWNEGELDREAAYLFAQVDGNKDLKLTIDELRTCQRTAPEIFEVFRTMI